MSTRESPVSTVHYQWKIAQDLFRHPRERSWIILAPTSLGETWMTCALARSFRERHGGPITLGVKASHAVIAQMFNDNDDLFRIVAVNGDIGSLCRNLQGFYRPFEMDVPILAHPDFVGDGRMQDFTYLFAYPGRGGIGFVDLMRHLLHLDWEAPLALPKVPELWREEARVALAELGVEPGRGVFLFPDNNTCMPVADEIWQSLADRLRARGLTPITNLHGADMRGPRTQPFAGTLGMRVPLHLAIPLVEQAGRFISGSNGIAVMLVGSGVQARASILLHKARPGLTHWHDFRVDTDPYLRESPAILLRPSGLTPYDMGEYIVVQDGDNSDLIEQIVNDCTAFSPPSLTGATA